MEEDLGVKVSAPVTRLRRRLSVEAPDDIGSPGTPSTPTKRRGRLATKPNLDLIDENAPVVNSPRLAKKTDELNISVAAEKALTPARRSTRIKSNTSLTSESISTCNSPRAKRAARRSSVAGSDNETNTPAKPAKTITRGESLTIVDAPIVENPGSAKKNIEIHISEPVEQKTTRRSARIKSTSLTPETVQNSNESKSERKSISGNNNKTITTPSNSSRRSSRNKSISENDSPVLQHENTVRKYVNNKCKNDSSLSEEKENKSISPIFKNERLSKKSIETQKSPKFEKEEPSVNIMSQSHSKLIDNISPEPKKGKKKLSKSIIENTSNTGSDEKSLNHDKRRKSATYQSSGDEHQNNSISKKNKLNKSKDTNNIEEIKKSESKTSHQDNASDVILMFQKSPATLKATICAEDSDSNMGDQCVPSLNSLPNKNNSMKKIEQDVEPMDIDETMPENTSILDNEGNSKLDKDQSSINYQPKMSLNENKSTLILSQISIQENVSNKSNSKSLNNSTSDSCKIPFKGFDTPINQKKNIFSAVQTSTPVTISSAKNNSLKSERSFNNISKDDDKESSKSNSLLNDEASEDDSYESGDSLDDKERQYIEDNQIPEKGETLSSEDDEISEDDDYENDSFVVSSGDDNNELLSGSGDDLEISQNDSQRSRNSTRKEHKKNKSDRSKHSFDSNLLSLDENEGNSKKKHKRLRLDSTNENINKNQSKLNVSNKHDDDTMCDGSVLKENEITLLSNSLIDKNQDPIRIEYKQEVLTPDTSVVKSIANNNISTEVEIERIDVENSLINKSTNQSFNNTLQEDPLSSGDNEEIIGNYDLVLKQLSKNKKGSKKSHHLSLNANTETNEPKSSIIEQLNITDIKKSKKKKKQSLNNNKSGNSSSDSLDMKLLFSEDSNDVNTKHQNVKKNEVKSDLKITDKFNKSLIDENIGKNTSIKSPFKMNNSETSVMDNNDGSFVKKTKNRKSINLDATPVVNNDVSVSTITSSKKKKKNKSIETFESNEEENTNISKSHQQSKNDSFNDLCCDVSLNSSIKKKKDKCIEPSVETDLHVHDSSMNTPGSKKKKKRLSQNTSTDFTVTHCSDDNKQFNMSVTDENKEINTIYKSPEKKISLETSVLDINLGNNEDLMLSKTKKKNKKSLDSELTPVIAINDDSENKTSSSKKKKSRVSESHQTDEENKIDSKQNKKSAEEFKDLSELYNCSAYVAYKSSCNNIDSPNCNIKKKKKKSFEAPIETINNIHNSSLNTSSSEKKKNLNKNSSVELSETVNLNHENVVDTLNILKKKIPGDDSQQLSEKRSKQNKASISSIETSKKKKDKQKYVIENKEPIDIETNFNSGTTNNQKDVLKKTQKISKKKKREDDENSESQVKKVRKASFLDDVHVSRLPTSFIKSLKDKPDSEYLTAKKNKVISTSNFIVKEAIKRKNKPSTYLEESVYLNEDSPKIEKKKNKIKNPRVLPFMPTVSTSYAGFTSNIKVNVTSENNFTVQSNCANNFKNDMLYGRGNIKRYNSYELCKKQRNVKLTKF